MASTQSQTSNEQIVYGRQYLLDQLDGEEAIVRELEDSFAGDWPGYEAALWKAAHANDAEQSPESPASHVC